MIVMSKKKKGKKMRINYFLDYSIWDSVNYFAMHNQRLGGR